MSTTLTLQDPVLGKRKSIGPFDQFSAKGEAVLVEKEEAILGEKNVGVGEDEKASDVDEIFCSFAAAKDEVIWGEKKDATVDEKEKEIGEDPCVGVGEDDYDEAFRRLANEGVVIILGKKKDASVDEERGKCRICEDPVHMNCPWVRGLYSKTVPVFRPLFRALCKRCGNTEFNKCGVSDTYVSCTNCRSYIICAVRKSCPWCLKTGHLDMEDTKCFFYGKQWTPEEDPFLKALFKRHNI